MKLEEAIQWLNDFTNIIAINKQYIITEGRLTKVQEAIETVLQALENKQKEIKKLYTIRNERDYGYENTHIITQDRLITIEKNKYSIEIEDGKFVDIKELYENSIPKKKIEDKLQNLLNKVASAGLDGFYDEIRDIKRELLEDK